MTEDFPSASRSPAAQYLDNELSLRIWRRYGSSPGIIATARVSAQYDRLARFNADHLPLLALLQRRWTTGEHTAPRVRPWLQDAAASTAGSRAFAFSEAGLTPARDGTSLAREGSMQQSQNASASESPALFRVARRFPSQPAQAAEDVIGPPGAGAPNAKIQRIAAPSTEMHVSTPTAEVRVSRKKVQRTAPPTDQAQTIASPQAATDDLATGAPASPALAMHRPQQPARGEQSGTQVEAQTPNAADTHEFGSAIVQRHLASPLSRVIQSQTLSWHVLSELPRRETTPPNQVISLRAPMPIVRRAPDVTLSQREAAARPTAPAPLLWGRANESYVQRKAEAAGTLLAAGRTRSNGQALARAVGELSQRPPTSEGVSETFVPPMPGVPPPAIDLEQLAEQVWRLLHRRLTAERERRGI